MTNQGKNQQTIWFWKLDQGTIKTVYINLQVWVAIAKKIKHMTRSFSTIIKQHKNSISFDNTICVPNSKNILQTSHFSEKFKFFLSKKEV